MNTRRIPFQFSTTDPLARQRELEKRFGLQPTCPKMYVDVNKPLSMDATPNETSSPRLQHRVPIFAEDYNQPIHLSSVDSMSSIPDKKSNVRVIPIEVEGADRSPRHRTYSGPADTLKDRRANLASERIDRFPFKRCNFEDSSKLNAEPRVYNIPIQIEGANNVSRNFQPKIVPKSQTPKLKVDAKPKSVAPTVNNKCSQSKLPNTVKSSSKDDKVQSELIENKVDQLKNNVEICLKKIEDVFTEFKKYETEVVEFTGTSQDKQYRYLDEMLTRCMLRLDDIDTMGNEEIRLARKNAVKKVQASIDLLESKANGLSAPVENILEKNDDNDVEMQDKSATSNENNSSEIKDIDLTQNNNESESKTDLTQNNNESESKTDLTQSNNEDESKTSDTIVSNTEIGSKVESAEVTLQNVNNITDVEMSEIKEELDDGNKDDKSLTSSLQQQQNSIPEIEMSEETSMVKMNSSNDTHSTEVLESDSKSIEQNEMSSETLTNDIEMYEKSHTSIEIKESPSVEETADNISSVNKSSEVLEVEMVDVQDISSKETEEECETVENSTSCNFECSEQTTNEELHPNDIVFSKSSSNLLDSINQENGNKLMPEQEVKCVSNQSDELKTL